MKALLAVTAAAVLLAFGASQAAAGNHSGPEAYAKGTGSTGGTTQVNTPLFGCAAILPFIGCISGQVGTTTVTTTTAEDFTFSAKAGPQTLTPLDPTDGPFGTMRLTYHQTVATVTTVFGNCIQAPCPVPSSNTTTKNADVTADVTCLQVVNNTASVGGHVTKFSGDFPATRGLLFNGVDNTVAGQQVGGADLFDGAFVADAPQACPAPSGGHPITSGDVYVDQS